MIKPLLLSWIEVDGFPKQEITFPAANLQEILDELKAIDLPAEKIKGLRTATKEDAKHFHQWKK